VSGFDINGDGLVDMRIDGAARGIGELHGRADALASLLAGAFVDIDALTGKLGKGGKMSDQFMADYRKWRQGAGSDADPGLDKSIKDVPVNYHKIAETGDKAVATYRTAEQNAANRFRR
jgi:hypothetical protein